MGEKRALLSILKEQLGDYVIQAVILGTINLPQGGKIGECVQKIAQEMRRAVPTMMNTEPPIPEKNKEGEERDGAKG